MGNKFSKDNANKSPTNSTNSPTLPTTKTNTTSTKTNNKNLPITPLTSGLYTTCLWTEKDIKKLVYEKHIAPLYKGLSELIEDRDDIEECPICLLNYEHGLNRLKCCKQSICSECYLQVKKPPHLTDTSVCPFCSSEGYSVTFRGELTETEIESRKEEERKVKELEEKMRMDEIKKDEERKKKREEEKQKTLLPVENVNVKYNESEQIHKDSVKDSYQPSAPSLHATPTKDDSVLNKNLPPVHNVNEEEMDEEMRMAIQLSLQENKNQNQFEDFY
eukprot:TRINITY_DN4165_c0_g1_i1.p1 TRINITY_DN4165_c0_g1~~TRINITY_DN4165_c0_g1_i1.p1  ORF type:complete len:275 (+),score=90.46 TRINITY_DN4165_c0_g1_i1:204-1028(+)